MIIDDIKTKKDAFEVQHGQAPKHVLVGATELKAFIEENIPNSDDDPTQVTGVQFTSIFGMQLVAVLKISYLEVC